jgi:H+/Cl- antiporter ClcA
MAVVWATRRYVPGAAGSGIPQAVAATQLAAIGRPVDALLSIKVAVDKVLLGSLALIGGFSAGREGPSVQVAASVLNLANRFLPRGRALRTSDLILAGGAAGIAAAANTPLAGIVFAVEELGRRLESRTSGVLVSGGVVVAMGWVSDGTPFGSGYAAASQAIAGRLTLEWHTPITRFIATLAPTSAACPAASSRPRLRSARQSAAISRTGCRSESTHTRGSRCAWRPFSLR